MKNNHSVPKPGSPDIPRGYMPILEIEMNGHLLRFGPFTGYYFKPRTPDDFSRLAVLCFNEDFFYTRDRPVNALLFKGDAALTTLEPVDVPKAGTSTGSRVVRAASPLNSSALSGLTT